MLIEIPMRSFLKNITNTIYKVEWTFFKGKGDEYHNYRVIEKNWGSSDPCFQNTEKNEVDRLKKIKNEASFLNV